MRDPRTWSVMECEQSMRVWHTKQNCRTHTSAFSCRKPPAACNIATATVWPWRYASSIGVPAIHMRAWARNQNRPSELHAVGPAARAAHDHQDCKRLRSPSLFLLTSKNIPHHYQNETEVSSQMITYSKTHWGERNLIYIYIYIIRKLTKKKS